MLVQFAIANLNVNQVNKFMEIEFQVFNDWLLCGNILDGNL